MVKIIVPATTANLGPGFDSFGLAFNLNNIFYFEENTSNEIIYENIDSRFCNENNLAIIAYKKALNKLNVKYTGLKIKIDSNIPICRGLGSSASLIVAGLMFANYIHKNVLTKNDILQLATEIEGHPDNVAPAIFGGLNVSLLSDNGIAYSSKCLISDKIKFCVFVPNFELSTEKARSVLPKQISYSDALFNISHSSFLLKALELGDFDKIKISLQDKLHQPYRKKLIDEYEDIENISYKNGAVAFCISGAGPTLLSIYFDDSFIDKVRESVKNLKNGWKVIPLSVNNDGAKIID